MKPYEIALFKNYLTARGVATIYIGLYRKFRLDKNPASIEAFLQEAEPESVCTAAFYWIPNMRYGYDFWSSTQERWMDFYNSNKDNYSAKDWYKMKGVCKALRCNWDAEHHWALEKRGVAAKRMGIDVSVLLQDSNNTDNKNTDPLGDCETIDIRPKRNNSRHLAEDEVSINLRNNKSVLTFNQKTSQDILAGGGYKYASLLRCKNGDIVVKLNNTDTNGATIQDGAKERGNVVISSKMLVGKLAVLLNINEDYQMCKISEIAKTCDYVAYSITKK